MTELTKKMKINTVICGNPSARSGSNEHHHIPL